MRDSDRWPRRANHPVALNFAIRHPNYHRIFEVVRLMQWRPADAVQQSIRRQPGCSTEIEHASAGSRVWLRRDRCGSHVDAWAMSALVTVCVRVAESRCDALGYLDRLGLTSCGVELSAEPSGQRYGPHTSET